MIITIGRKPYEGALVGNILDNQCGGINIEGTRVVLDGSANGRFPANVLLSEGTTTIMDDQSGISRSPKTYVRNADGFNNGVYSDKKMIGEKAGSVSLNFGDEGGASRYFKVVENE